MTNEEATHTLYVDATPLARVYQEDCELLTIVGSYALLPAVRERPDLEAALAWHDQRVSLAAALTRVAGDPVAESRVPTLAWLLVDATGRRFSIATPDFLTNRKIVWRWT